MFQIGSQTNIQHTAPVDKRGTDKTGNLNQKDKTSQSQGYTSGGHETKEYSSQLMQAFQLLKPLLEELLQKLLEHQQPKQEVNPQPNKPPVDHLDPPPQPPSIFDPPPQPPSIIDPPPPPHLNLEELDLSQKQHDTLSQYFNDLAPLAYDGQATEYTGTTLDKDGDNKLSEGDIVELRHFGGNGPIGSNSDSFEYYALTAADISAIDISTINDPSSKDLSLSKEEKHQLEQAVIPQDGSSTPGLSSIESVEDNDDNGKLSVGDSIKIVQTHAGGGPDPSTTTHFQSLTQAQLDRYEAGVSYKPDETIDLSDDQSKALEKRFSGYGHTILDSNGDNKLSVGDQLQYSNAGIMTPGDDWESHILTAEDVAAINGETVEPPTNNNQLLELSTSQKDIIENDLGRFRTDIDHLGITITDQNGDEKVSAGDNFKATVNPDTFEERTLEHTLSADEARHINGEFGAKLDISLDYKQNMNFDQALGLDSDFESVDFIFDTDGDQKLSVGDIAVVKETHALYGDVFGDRPPEFPTQYHRLTHEDIAKINGETVEPPTNNNQLLELSTSQKDIIENDLGLFSTDIDRLGITITDQNGDGKVSAGDNFKAIANPDTSYESTLEHTLSADEARHINGEFGAKLDISLDYKQNMNFDQALGLDSNFESVNFIFDTDGDQKLSVGDIAVVKDPHAFVGDIGVGDRLPEFPTQYHRLTHEDIAKINGETDKPHNVPETPIDLTKSEESVIRDQFQMPSQATFEVFDKAGEKTTGKLSVGDTIKTSIEGQSFTAHITLSDLITIEQAEDRASKQEELVENRAKWDSQGLEEYSFTQVNGVVGGSNGAFTNTPIRIGVNSTGASDITVSGHDDNSDYMAYPSSKSIDNLFDLIDRSLDKNHDFVNVEYDSETGHPAKINIGPKQIEPLSHFNENSQGAKGGPGSVGSDGGFRLTISDLREGFQPLSNFEEIKPQPQPNPNTPNPGFMNWFTDNVGDINEDGAVNKDDVRQWLKGAPPPPALPEQVPSTGDPGVIGPSGIPGEKGQASYIGLPGVTGEKSYL